ncbi:MAG: class I SAM-dependent methyltransferase [Magnetospirillum sp.]|nr:class I SAM-dependent methyltransferase [Magnetospirillum sp.]
MFVGEPPAWALRRPKGLAQAVYDVLGAPLRMVLLPDHVNERLHLTSLRAERLSMVLPRLEGRVLDIGAGDNMLVKLHRRRQGPEAADSVGLDVVDWGGGCTIVPDCKSLPFPDGSFDTVTFVACLNHIPERREALAEAYRVLRPGGKVVITMIGRFIGKVGHMLWWYSEDKHRDVDEHEEMGMNPGEIESLLKTAGFGRLVRHSFVYDMNHMFVAQKPE